MVMVRMTHPDSDRNFLASTFPGCLGLTGGTPRAEPGGARTEKSKKDSPALTGPMMLRGGALEEEYAGHVG